MAYPVIKLSTAAKFYNFLDDKKSGSARLATYKPRPRNAGGSVLLPGAAVLTEQTTAMR
ncbi:hypothetical protein GCM10011409_16820 [Lentibacillus populi]|uniref:Uncharacterized protein n=1 Tax=Lentibacillus populi TaxID=1827502 RepID=A0A9W5TX85_9BACI|nr:hypothetical protein GCM10011409_16820 [Lentibacillus populi]